MTYTPPAEGRKQRTPLLIPVPWKQADSLQSRLAAGGIAATACFEPREHTALIEVPADADVATVRALLGLRE
jgi:hypothetical protein